MKTILNYIDGEFLPSHSNAFLENINPSTGYVYGEIPRSNTSDIDFAIDKAEIAFKTWSNTTLETRSKTLMRIADLIDENLDQLAMAESNDNGKPLHLAKSVDIPRASANFRFFAHALTQFYSESHESQGKNTINYTLRKALGLVGCISPWNLPLYLLTWKIAPALAAGNTVIAKPSEVTPMTAFLLCKICEKAGLPNGVLNMIHGLGPEAGQAIVEHPKIKAISFTGGTKTGENIARTAAPMFKKLSLELGGKNPNIIFADCDYEKMMRTTLKSSFANQGQICLCGSRIFVEDKLYEKFKTDFVNRVKALKIGHPIEDNTDLGAIVSEPHLKKIKSYIDKAKKDPKMKVLCGGDLAKVKKFPNGYYLNPCVIEVQDNQCQLNQEEIFGPVVSMMSFKTEEEVLKMANDSVYGLSSTLWTQNLNRSMRMSQALETGIVWVNTWLNRDLRTPFGGTKQSGVGREGGFEALRFFTEPKNVCIEYS
ncbi:aldehyde dehydrogenase [Flavobacteriaceae bacterium 14752]|uniref:aldehyde dehydrogenase n=1 Tax=Mesohalobacter salilacus TaxID=2491711 RepID=UPI000F637C47|nr:aldehyde dehydrogenase [Flavobacteriaceae bacterium 14752]